MRSLPKPEHDPEETFDLCISRVRNAELKVRLEAIRVPLRTAAADYDVHGVNRSFHRMLEHDQVGGVSGKELEGVYTSRMVGQNAPGRGIYDELRSSAPHDVCPFCGQRMVGTLDHYLPKSEFPSYVVTPNNLVPSCSDCNFAKKTYIAKTEQDQLLHPYYDDFSDDQWLFAELAEDSCSLSYYVKRVGHISAIQAARLKKNFDLLALNDLYTSHASAELVNIKFQLEEVYAVGGKDQVQLHLDQAYRSRCRIHVNSWQTAFYQALSESDEFCDGGFRGIGA